MTVQFIITIDTEEDSWGDYQRADHSVDNIQQIPQLQALFDRYGAMPTYLVNWPVLMDNDACGILKEIHGRGRCEIGSHCHPWNTPPVEEEINSVNSMMSNLPPKLVKAKIARLVQATEERLGLKPTSFRAGRWGFGRHVAEALVDNGYLVDSSVCPSVDWRRDAGPDYFRASDKPYRFSPAKFLDADAEGALWEVPASIGFLQGGGSLYRTLRRALASPAASRLHLIGLLERMKIMNFRWFSPELSPAAEMIALARALIRTGCPILNLSFHSTTLLPGKSPYVQSQKDLNDFLHRIEQVLQFAVESKMEFSSLSASVGGDPGCVL